MCFRHFCDLSKKGEWLSRVGMASQETLDAPELQDYFQVMQSKATDSWSRKARQV